MARSVVVSKLTAEKVVMKPLLLVLGSLLALASSVAAGPAAAATLSTDASACDVFTGICDAHSGTFPAVASFEGASGFADAGFGVVSAVGTAAASTSISDPVERFNADVMDRTGTRGVGIADFTDTITFHGASPGDFVQVRIETRLHADVSSLGYDLAYWCSPGNIGFFRDNVEAGATLAFIGSGLLVNANHTLGLTACDSIGGSADTSFTTTLFLPTEQPFGLEVNLRAQAEANPFFGRSPLDLSHVATSVTASADAANTGLLFIDVLTPGASFTSESGALYQPVAVAVPAPAGSALVGVALMCFVVLRRRVRSLRP